MLVSICLLASVRGSAGAETVVPLGVVGKAADPNRLFTVPVVVHGRPAQFALGCNGPTRISERFARECGLPVKPDADTRDVLDANGRPIYAGTADVRIEFGGAPHSLSVPVMRDEHCQEGEKQGMLGFDLINPYQWEVNPDPKSPTLTLRPAGTPAEEKGGVLAVVPLTTDGMTYLVTATMRGTPAELELMPGSSFVQVGPDLQRKWDLNSGVIADVEVQTFGDVKVFKVHGKDVIELGQAAAGGGVVKESEFQVALVGDPADAPPADPDEKPLIQSGLGQAVLNRFVYCVDSKRGELVLKSRLGDKKAAKTPGATRRSSVK